MSVYSELHRSATAVEDAQQTRVEHLQAIADALDTLIAQHDLALDLINDLPLATRATNTLGMQLIEDRNAIAAQLRGVNAEIARACRD